MRQGMREINALKGRVCVVPPIGSPGQPQRQRGRSVQRCVKTDCLVAVRGRDDKRRGPWRTGRVRPPRSHPRPRERERERGSRRQRARVGRGEQRAEGAEGEGRLSSRATQSEFGAQRQQSSKGSKAAKQQLEETRSRHTLKMGACVPANNNPGLSSLRSTLLLKRAARGVRRSLFASRSAGRWTAGAVADWSGAAHARNAMEYGSPSGCAALE